MPSNPPYRQCIVCYHQVEAGIIAEYPKGYLFTYNAAYFDNEHTPPISLTLPKTQRTHQSTVLFPCFSNLLWEGQSRNMVCRTFGIDRDDSFGLILHLAKFNVDTIGAISFKEHSS